jgi:hypothetical protein
VTAPVFHITIPAWGARYVDVAARYAVPAVLKALDAADFDLACRFHVFTDAPARLRMALKDEDVDWQPMPPGGGFHGLTKAHRATLAVASPDSIVLLLNADIVVSVEAITQAVKLLSGRTKVLVSTGIRTAIGNEKPPIGADAAALFAWAWRNRHPFMEDSVWCRGRTKVPTTVFFERDGSVVCRCFHLHPFFVRKDRALDFKGTIDDDLLARYAPDEMRVLTEREIGFAELSPPDRRFSSGPKPLTEADIIQFGRNFLPAHVRNFTHPIRICGDGPVDDGAWKAIAKGLGWRGAA